MAYKFKTATLNILTRLFGSGYGRMFVLCIAFGVIAFGSLVVIDLIERRYREVLKHQLNTVLDSTSQAIQDWGQNHRLAVQSYAQSKVVLEAAIKFLEFSPNKNELLASPLQTLIRQHFLLDQERTRYLGFFLIGPDNISLAAPKDISVGDVNPLTRHSEILDRLWRGETLIAKLQISNRYLISPTEEAHRQGDEVSLFVGAPVRNATGKVIALLILHIDPTDMSTILRQGRIGKTGESYAFDREGKIISRSRFEKILLRTGLPKPGETSVSRIRLIDPGVDLTKGEKPSKVSNTGPLTLMASSATRGNRDINLGGYRDYRGVLVVGAWLWDDELDIGMTTEQDVAEAYDMFYFFRILIIGAAFGFCFILLSLAIIFNRGRRQLREVRVRLEAIVETALDGILVIDDNGLIESANPVIEKLFGYSLIDLIGKNMNMLMSGPYHGEQGQHTGEARVTGTDLETEGRRVDGSSFPMELSINRLELDTGMQFSIIIRDITQRKEYEASIILAGEEAEAANQAKSNFLATMSHEIRTPLNGVVATIDMLNYTNLDKNQQNLVHTARNSSMLLQSIIDDVLDFSKIEAGRLDLEQIPLSLENLVEELGEALLTLAWDKDVDLLIYCDPAMPGVIGDPVRLKQIIFNLAGNAIKFSSGMKERRGQVVISVLLHGLKDGSAEINLVIRDNGIGMNPEAQKGLFQPFTQAEENTTRRFGGTGLGLTITSRLIDVMEGSIKVQSEEGKGSIFTVSLTLVKAVGISEIDLPDLQGIQVLLVKTDSEAALILSYYLDDAGATVTLVSIEEAVSRFRVLNTDYKDLVVIIDSQGDDDISDKLRTQLRQEANETEVLFVVIERGRRRSARLSDKGGITFDLDAMKRRTLLNAVKSVVARMPPEHTGLIREQTSSLSLKPDEGISSGKLILLVDDNETNRKVISQQLSLLGYTTDLAEDGVQALSMWQNRNYDLLLSDCHMPEMDGYDLARNIRKEETQENRVPIIAITADALKGTKKKCLAAGMDDYLTKPMQLHDLLESLEKWLPAAPKVQPEPADVSQESELQISGSEEPETDSAIDPLALGGLLGIEDPSMLLDFYTDFLQASVLICDELQQAYASEDLLKVGEIAHKLKSSARTVGANALADCCLTLEESGYADDRQVVDRQMRCFTPLFQQVQEWIEAYQSSHR